MRVTSSNGCLVMDFESDVDPVLAQKVADHLGREALKELNERIYQAIVHGT